MHVQFDQHWIKHVLPMHLKFYTISEKVLAVVPFISCMAGKVFVMTHVRHEYHIEVKKSGGAFKLSQQFSCTTIVACFG